MIRIQSLASEPTFRNFPARNRLLGLGIVYNSPAIFGLSHLLKSANTLGHASF